MESFNDLIETHMTEWRRAHLDSQEWGRQNNRRYFWVLPTESWEEGLWPGIRTGSDNSLSAYLERTGVQKHRYASNLKSSWTMCANLYFPFRASPCGRDLLASFLRRHVSEEIYSLEAIELEYAAHGPLSPLSLLGETGGWRGANQTSPDLGLLVNQDRGIVLVENKFTEHDFYKCSAWKHPGNVRTQGNPDPDRCLHPLEVAKDPSGECHQSAWGRRYWQQLADMVDLEALGNLPHCPAAMHGYQLFRQQALAEGMAQSGRYDLVVSAVAVDERNDILAACLEPSGLDELRQWGSLFRGKARFEVFTHQQWAGWVQEHDTGGRWTDWLDYVRLRYGLIP